MNQYGVNLDKAYRKIFWLGIIMNIVCPIVYVIIAFSMKYSEEPPPKNNVEHLDIILYALIAVSICIVIASLVLRQKRFFSPMIKSKETFEKDFSRESFNSAIIVNSMIVAIAIYGLIFFFLSGQIEYLFYFAIPSVMLYILIRPNYSLLEMSLAAQEKFVSEGKFFKKSFGLFPF